MFSLTFEFHLGGCGAKMSTQKIHTKGAGGASTKRMRALEANVGSCKVGIWPIMAGRTWVVGKNSENYYDDSANE